MALPPNEYYKVDDGLVIVPKIIIDEFYTDRRVLIKLLQKKDDKFVVATTEIFNVLLISEIFELETLLNKADV